MLASSRSVVVAACLALLGCTGDVERAPALEHLSHGPDAEYVGIAECRRCHQDIAATYTKTGMGRSWYPLTPAIAVEDWSDDNEIEIPGTGLRYRMQERDGKYFMRQFRAASDGGELAVDERELVWVVGSNHHSRSYAVELDGELFQAPICWYPDAEVWDLCPGFGHENNHFRRGITQSCVFCHNGRMVVQEGEHHRFEGDVPFGIGCERCHGPGSLHVAKWDSGEHEQSGEHDPTIVNPRRLPLEKRIQVCMQCHLGDSGQAERVMRWDRRLTDFRPGQGLSEIVLPFRLVDQLEGSYALTGQADRLLQSRCFKESGGRLECLTCHNPHVTVYAEERAPDFYREKCLGCHAVEDCVEDDEARQATASGEGDLFRGGRPGEVRSVVFADGSGARAPDVDPAAGAVADNCIVCHMRVAEPSDQRHTVFVDHWIRRDITADPAERRETLAMEPILPALERTFSDAEVAFYRGRANLIVSLKTPDPRRRSMWEDAERSFEAAIDGGIETEQASFFLARAREYLGRRDAAGAALQRAYEQNPGNYDAAFAWGQHLFENGEVDVATRVFEGMQARWPDDPGVLAELARCRIVAGRVEEAVELYTRAIESRPWEPSLYEKRGRALAQLGHFADGAVDAERAVRLNPDDRGAWEFYARIMEAAGRGDDAAEGRRVVARLR
jgi:Tfp pilus assembly protein PilF